MSVPIVVSVFLVGLAAVLFTATFIATRRDPQPWWVQETPVSIGTVPFILTLFVSGLLSLGANLIGGWRTIPAAQWLEAIGVGVAAVVICRFMLGRWRARNGAVQSATVIPLPPTVNTETTLPPLPAAPRKAA